MRDNDYIFNLLDRLNDYAKGQDYIEYGLPHSIGEREYMKNIILIWLQENKLIDD